MKSDRLQLLEAVTALSSGVHPDNIERLASMIQVGEVNDSKVSLEWGGSLDQKELVENLLVLWRSTNISAEEFAGMLRGTSIAYHSARSEESVDLVWTGPSTEYVATRRTEQVLIEVIDSAQTELFLVSFVAYKVDSIIVALQRAADRGVETSILLESSDHHGGGVSVDSIGQMREVLPRANIYHWKRKEGDFGEGRVHAKVVVADGKICFISSANLTGYAMDKNMEAGVLIRGGDVPSRLHGHLNALVAVEMLST